MADRKPLSARQAAGFLLVLGFVAAGAGVVMFSVRGGAVGGAPPSFSFLVVERGLFTTGVILNVLGFALLEGYLHDTNGWVLTRVGAAAYLFGGILLATAEALGLSFLSGSQVYPLIVIYVILGFLGQAAIGAGLLGSGLLSAWIGWVTILWNVGLLVYFPIVSPTDLYFPMVHHPMPLLIGVALLLRAPEGSSLAS